MEDFVQIIIYVAALIIYLISKARKAKNAAPKQNVPPSERQNPTTYQNEPHRPAPVTLEDMLREFGQSLEEKRTASETKTEIYPERTTKKSPVKVFDKKKHEADNSRSYEYAGYDKGTEKQFQDYQNFDKETEKQTREYENYDKGTEKHFDDLQNYDRGVEKHFDQLQNYNEIGGYHGGDIKFEYPVDHEIVHKNPYADLLKDPEGIRQAFILKEILDRKYR